MWSVNRDIFKFFINLDLFYIFFMPTCSSQDLQYYVKQRFYYVLLCKTVARGILILFLILEEKLLLVSMLAVGVHMWISLSWTFSFIFYLFFNIQWKGIEFLEHSPALIELILGFSLIILLMYLVTVFDFQNITSFIVFTYILVSNTIFSLLTPYFYVSCT